MKRNINELINLNMKKIPLQPKKSIYPKHYKATRSMTKFNKQLPLDSARIIKSSREWILKNKNKDNTLNKPNSELSNSISLCKETNTRIGESTFISTDASSEQQLATERNYTEDAEILQLKRVVYERTKRLQESAHLLLPELDEIIEENATLEDALRPLVTAPPLIRQRNSLEMKFMTKTIKCSPLIFLRPITREMREHQKKLKKNESE